MMTSWRSLALLLLLGLSGGALGAQTTVELLTTATETGNTNSGSPFNTYWYDTRTEAIYLASELTAAGVPANANISAIQFKCYTPGGMTLEAVRIRVQQTSATTLSAFTSSGWSDKYGPSTLAAASLTAGGWYTFTFSTPFQWNGTSNLHIDYTNDGNAYVSGGGCYWRTVSGVRCGYAYNDNGYTYPFDGMWANYGGSQAMVPSMRVTYTGGTAPATITVTSAANPLSLGTTTQGTAGTAASYSVSGANLTSNITITAPSTSVQVSLSAGSGYAASVQLTPTSGTVSATTIYARITTVAPQGAVSGNIAHTATGATTQNLAVSGNVTAPVPSITVTSGTNPLALGSTITGTAGTPASYTVVGANLTADIVVTAPANVEISQTGAAGTYANAQTLTQTGGSVNATIHARITAAAPVGAVSGNITHTSTGATQQNLAVTGTVTVPPPTITLGGATPPLALGTVFQGTAGTPVSYTVSGANLTADIVVTAPANVEISQTGAAGTYATAQTLTQAGGVVNATIHARIAASAAIGAVSGNITHVSTTASQNMAVSGTVNPTAPDMAVTRSAAAVADGGTDALGNRPFGVASSLTYTIANSGTAALSLSGMPPVVATAGTNCSVLVTAQPTPTSVAIASTVTFTVEVTPTAAGAFDFTVSIANNDTGAGKNPYNWTASGTGVTAPAMTLQRTAAIADGGSDAIGTVSTTIPLTLTYTVGNSGTATLNLSGAPRVAVSGLTNCVVSVTTQPAATVAVAGTTTFVVSVRATASGAISFTLSIDNDDPIANPYNFTVGGTGAGGITAGAGGGGGGGGACEAGHTSTLPVLVAFMAVLGALAIGRRRARA